ncbi:MAG: hypothetical protein U0793_03745 [Gemmataceae bacterium]
MRLVSLTLLLTLIPCARADEPKTEPAPPPRVLVAPPPENLFLPIPRGRPGTLDNWNNYAVDSFGRWRPRVIAAPFGSYYYYNGAPFPWTATHSLSWRSSVQE